MPSDYSLKRLGGGRWETRDGRFTIEPQSGTWVVVDNTQTDELGLPLVRGPFGSLTAAKEAIEGVRGSGPVESPLAERLRQANTHADMAGAARHGDAAAHEAKRTRAAQAAGDRKGQAEPAMAAREEPPPPAEPRWHRELAPADRRRARELIDRLGELGIDDPERISRAELVRDEPALTRLALERVINAAIASARSPGGAGRAVVDAIMRGRDPELHARWKVVDDRGRRIDALDVSD